MDWSWILPFENLALRNYYKEPFCHKGVLDQKIFEDNSEN